MNRADVAAQEAFHYPFMWSPTASGANSPSKAFFVKGRPTRLNCLSVVEVVPQTANNLPPLVTTSRSIEITIEEAVHPARKFLGGAPAGVPPLIKDCLRSRLIEDRTAGRIQDGSVFQRRGCLLVGGPGSPHVIEEWVITRSGEDTKSMMPPLKSHRAARIAACIINVAGP